MSNTDGTSGIAYAQASWARFDQEISDELLRAICGAFALVSAADGSVSPSEVERFSEVLADTSARFPALDLAKADGLFRQLGQAILSDPDDGRRRVLREVAAVRDDPKHCDLVRSAALIAIEADGRTLESEEAVLGEIAFALGL
jgi:tellurite resistance protein